MENPRRWALHLLLFSLTLTRLEPSALAEGATLPPFRLGLSYQSVSTGFELQPKSPASGSASAHLIFRPAQSNYAGVVLGWNWLGGTVAFSVPAKREIRDVEGTSRYRDYRLSYYTHRFGGEIGYNRYFGYLIDNVQPLAKYPDLETLGYGGNALYVLNPESGYSLPAALDQSDIQTRSAGSWVLLGSLRVQKIQSNSPWIPASSQPLFGPDATLRRADTRALSGGGGYAYNWLPGGGAFFVSGLLGLTVGYQHVAYVLSSGDESLSSAGGNVHVRFGLGANAPRALITLGAYYDRIGQETRSIKTGDNISGVTLTGAVRF
jgi:hypothetical protein